MRSFKQLLEERARKYGDRFSARSLDRRFVRYFESGERIRVRNDHDGTTATGTVGVTTGWVPVFILMRTSRSLGSSLILDRHEHLVAVKRGRSYEQVTR